MLYLEGFSVSQILVYGLMILVGFGVFLQLLGLVSALLFRLTRVRELDRSKALPGVTIIKPCLDAADNEEENFDAFFNQDYPGRLELLFVVGSNQDPIVPIIRKYLAKYPAKDARLIFCATHEACSKKVDSLHEGQNQASHEIIIWSDSDVIIRANYVTQMVASLQEPGVSVVTTPQYDTRANNLGSAFKVLANNCDVAVYLMSYWLVTRRKRVAWGHSLGFWKAEFDQFKKEGWDLLNRFLADDLALPHLFYRHGKKIVFRNIYCPVQCSNKSLAQMVEQKKRWVLCQRIVVGNRYLYLFGLFSYPQVSATLLILATGFRFWAINLFIAIAFLRILVSAVFELLYLKSVRMTLKFFWTIILWDLSQFYFFAHGFLANKITFKGQAFKFGKTFLLEANPAEVLKIRLHDG